jgi:hypothetical protein
MSAEEMAAEGYSLLVEGWWFSPIKPSAMRLHKCVLSGIKTPTIKSIKLAR